MWLYSSYEVSTPQHFFLNLKNMKNISEIYIFKNKMIRPLKGLGRTLSEVIKKENH